MADERLLAVVRSRRATRGRTLRQMLAGIAVAAAVSGCFVGAATSQRESADMTADRLAGSWQTSDGEVLAFDSGGGFTATNLPSAIFEGFRNVLPPGFDPRHDKLPAEGKWDIERPPGASTGPSSRVHLSVRKLGGNPSTTGFDLVAQRADSETVLAIYIGDPDSDNRVVYRKCASACSPPKTPIPATT